jgi:predicted acetyltransferase
MSAEIRVCPPDRFAELLRAAEIPFAEDSPDDMIGRVERVADKERFVGAFDGDRIVGTSGVFTMKLQVPGGEVAAGGVTWVSVLPSHRRQGLMSGMMRSMIDDCHARGEPVAMLWAAEATIYQRFGYGLSTVTIHMRADSRACGFAREWPREGRFRLLPAGEGLDLVAPVYEEVKARQPGFLARTPDWWTSILPLAEKDAKGGEAKRLVVYETDAGPEAYAVYKTKSQWEHSGPEGVVSVDEAIGSTPRGTREIWRYLLELDLMRTLRAGRLPPDHPLITLASDPRRMGLMLGDGLWLRILDVAAALEARRYGADGHGSGSVVFDLADEYCPWNAGRWLLEVADGRARVTRTGATAELALTPNELGAMYLGAFGATALAAAGRIAELKAGALSRADLVFATPVRPWCPQEF